jgi:hypothetical protein
MRMPGIGGSMILTPARRFAMGLPNRIEVRDDALARLEDGLKLNLNEPTTKIRGHCTGAEGTRP